MKRNFLIFFSVILLGCSSNENNNNCNFLIDVGVNLTVNLDLPQFNQLNFPPNAVRVDGQGNAGIILVRVNSQTIRAWDGADPNHAPSSCSRLEINGLNATCGCSDANEYELLNGQIVGTNDQPCGLQEYRVQSIGGNSFSVTN